MMVTPSSAPGWTHRSLPGWSCPPDCSTRWGIALSIERSAVSIIAVPAVLLCGVHRSHWHVSPELIAWNLWSNGTGFSASNLRNRHGCQKEHNPDRGHRLEHPLCEVVHDHHQEISNPDSTYFRIQAESRNDFSVPGNDKDKKDGNPNPP